MSTQPPRGIRGFVRSDWLQKLSFVAATALATFVLGPYLTNKWQNHQQSIQTRSELVERIGGAVGRFTSAIRIEAYRREDAASGAYDAAFTDWQVESEAIWTQLQAYVGDPAVRRWTNYMWNMNRIYYLFKREGGINRGETLTLAANYLDVEPSRIDGLLDSPYATKRKSIPVNPTFDHALRELTAGLREKERDIISDVLE